MRFLTPVFDFGSRRRIAGRESRVRAFYSVCFLLWFIPSVVVGGDMARPEIRAEESRRYQAFGKSLSKKESEKSFLSLIEGVYRLVNEGDRDTAEDLFRMAIFSSSFDDLSVEDDAVAPLAPPDRGIVAEAFYFLGKIHYEKAVSQEDVHQNIAWAKKYLRKADEYGIVYDRLHPPLLDEIDGKYPGIDMAVSETEGEKAKVIVEIDHGSYKIDAVKIDQHADVTQSRFVTNEESDLECGARYKMKPDVQGGRRSIHRALTVLGIGLLVWLTRG